MNNLDILVYAIYFTVVLAIYRKLYLFIIILWSRSDKKRIQAVRKIKSYIGGNDGIS